MAVVNESQETLTKLGAEESSKSLPRELLDFLRQNKKWWLLPILVMLVGFGVLLLLSSSAAAPFIYTLF